GYDGEAEAAGDSGGAEHARNHQSHAPDAGRDARGGVAGSRRSPDRRPEQGESRDGRALRACAGDWRSSAAAQFASYGADAGVHESLRPVGFFAVEGSDEWVARNLAD